MLLGLKKYVLKIREVFVPCPIHSEDLMNFSIKQHHSKSSKSIYIPFVLMYVVSNMGLWYKFG